MATTEQIPLVSVIIPAFNAQDYIGQAIESVLAQGYPNLEVLVIDDGSSDGTPDIARAYGGFVTVHVQPNQGPAAARNLGVSLARGDLLAFVDADDVWLSGKLKAQIGYLNKHPDIGIVYGRFVFWHANESGLFASPPTEDENLSEGETIIAESGWIYPELLLDSNVWICTTLIRRQIWDKLGGMDEKLRVGEDWDFFLRASRQYQFTKLNRAVAYYRIHDNSTTRALRETSPGYQVLQMNLTRFGTAGPDGREVSKRLLRLHQFSLCFDHGYSHYKKNGSPQAAAKAFCQALDYRPFHLKTWFFFILSLVSCIKSGILGIISRICD